MRSNGGIIGAKKTVSPSAASGIWSLKQQQEERGALNFPPPFPFPVDYLVVAGGGAGGPQYGAGGGGAGGLRSTMTATGGGGSLESALTLIKNQNYLVTVGAGGSSSETDPVSVTRKGNDSVFSTVTSHGGGGGYGGSGGGGAAGGPGATSSTGAVRTYSDEGYSGGNMANGGSPGCSPYYDGQLHFGGGGGGTGAVGNNATGGCGGGGGAGGSGVAVSITGSSVTYGGGGSGGTHTGFASTAGGAGGGGAGGGTAGTENRGGGGGGSHSYTFLGGNLGGAGGSGVVILRYLTTDGTITIGAGLTGSTATDGSYKITTISAGSGNVSWA